MSESWKEIWKTDSQTTQNSQIRKSQLAERHWTNAKSSITPGTREFLQSHPTQRQNARLRANLSAQVSWPTESAH